MVNLIVDLCRAYSQRPMRFSMRRYLYTLGQHAKLNFPLSEEEKAELDALGVEGVWRQFRDRGREVLCSPHVRSKAEQAGVSNTDAAAGPRLPGASADDAQHGESGGPGPIGLDATGTGAAAGLRPDAGAQVNPQVTNITRNGAPGGISDAPGASAESALRMHISCHRDPASSADKGAAGAAGPSVA